MHIAYHPRDLVTANDSQAVGDPAAAVQPSDDSETAVTSRAKQAAARGSYSPDIRSTVLYYTVPPFLC